ncbi:hypothetical protein [Phenylobacterium immobile]|uniref:hypothetical protein n=1 Tax=Phenylobacterium immobile TaxID=21 RepID=UPI000AC5335E|nr:hypothetical protein [Phenylobacterium immobile]
MTHDEMNGAPDGVAADDAVYADGANFAPEAEDFGEHDPAAATEEEAHFSRRRSVQNRIDEITRERRQAERERDYWRDQATESDEAESYAPFDVTDPGHIRALAAEEARLAFAEIAERAQAEHERSQAHAAWDARQQAFSQEAPDYFDVLHATDWPCSEVMAEAIRTSDDGAAVAYHLAANPDQARRIARLPALAQIREIGRLESQLGRGPIPNLISQAPRPPAQIRGFGGRYRVSPDTMDFAAFDKAYG